MPKPVTKIYIKTPYMGYIAPLQMMGPIVTPMQVTQDQVVRMLKSGLNLFQYDPATKMTRPLTLATINQPMPTRNAARVATAAAEPVSTPQEPKVITGAKVVTPAAEPAAVSEEPAPAAQAEEGNATAGTAELIDESTIDWSSMTKAQRKEMRTKLEAQKAAQAAAEATATAADSEVKTEA